MNLQQEQEFIRSYQVGILQDIDLYNQYQRLIYYFIWKKGIRPDDVQDCFNDCVIRLFTLAKEYDFRNSKFTSFLLSDLRRITTNYSRAVHYWNKFFKSIEEINGDDDFDIPADDPEIDPFRFRLQEAINSLSDREKQIIYLHFFEGVELQIIGKMLGIPKGSMRKRENDALYKLRIILEGSNEV